jgi:hypothetical protein
LKLPFKKFQKPTSAVDKRRRDKRRRDKRRRDKRRKDKRRRDLSLINIASSILKAFLCYLKILSSQPLQRPPLLPLSGARALVDLGLLKLRFLNTFRHSRVDGTPLDEGSAPRRELKLTTHTKR